MLSVRLIEFKDIHLIFTYKCSIKIDYFVYKKAVSKSFKAESLLNRFKIVDKILWTDKK